MYALLFSNVLTAALTVVSVVDLTNSHAVQSFASRSETPAVTVPKTVWEVGVAPAKVFYVEATKIMKQGDLVLLADDEDEIVIAVQKEAFQYARKLRPNEKQP